MIQSALQGNNSALEQLFNMNLPKVYTLAFRLTANLKSAELLTETVLVEAWKQLSYLRDDATFSSWISSITVYQCLKYLREDENPQHFEMPQLPSKSPLEKTILSLSKNERVSFVLHHFEGYSIDEVSDLLAISRTEAESTIKSGENVVVSRTPDAISEKSLSNRINLIKTDISPANDIINKAFVTIYRLKSEDEVKEQYLSEKKSRDDSRAEEAKTVKGIAGFFKKKKPKS